MYCQVFYPPFQTPHPIFQAPISPISIAVIGAVTGAIVGGLLAYFFGIKLQRRQEKVRAGAEFISAFVEEVRKLESKRIPPNPGIIFMDGISKHMEAAIYFRYFLTKRKRKWFNEDWNAYYSQPDAYQCIQEKMVEYAQLLLERINKLLEYADQDS